MDKRPYHSPLRQEQALATRQRILDAALALFSAQGYAATSIASVAREAGVVPETIYAAFGSKRGIVDGLIERVAPPQVVTELRTSWTSAQGDPSSQVRVIAHFAREFWARNDGLATVFRLGVGDADIADEWQRRQSDRRGLFARLLETWPSGVLRPDLDLERAIDVFWGLSSDELYRLFVQDRGWPPDDYEAWLGDALERELLAT
ncbi:MAG: TetR/AcrR family transcriptional regulator [Chloroflexota bacterium]